MLQASGSTGKRRNGSHSQTLSGLNPVFATYKLFFFYQEQMTTAQKCSPL